MVVPSVVPSATDALANNSDASRWRSILWLLVLAVALAARLAMLAKSGDELLVDRDLYLGIASELAEGNGFRGPETGQPTAYRPPLYPLALAAVVKYGWPGLAGLHLMLGILTVATTVWSADRLGVGRLRALAGLLVALDPLLLQATTQLMTESLAALLAIGTIGLCAPANVGDPSPARSNGWRVVAGGVGLGLASLCRPTFLPWSLLVLLGLACEASRSRSRDASNTLLRAELRRLSWVQVIGASLALVLVLAPWVVRNQLVFGRPITATTHGGYTLLLGHNAVYDAEVATKPWGTTWPGASLAKWQRDLEQELAHEAPPLNYVPGQVDEVARDRWMSRKAWAFILADPGRAFRAAGSFLGRFWNVVPLGDGSLPKLAKWGVGGWYVVLYLLAAGGLVRILRERIPGWFPCLALIATFTLVHSLYWADMRMRAPLSPVLALLAVRCLTKRQGASPPVTR